VPAPASDPAPKLTLHAPELLRVSARDRVLRFVVYSTGEGALEATLGGTPLGEKSLRTGNNDVRFVLPATVFAGLRKPAASNVLRLTSFSPSGAEGATITRAVAVQKATKKSKKR
jgi:hypothetical protein